MTTLFSSTYKTYINHTDAGGIVYHGNYLTFYENCRRDWFTKLGFDGYFLHEKLADGSKSTLHPVVSNANVKFIRPILIDALIEVRVDKIIVKPASLTFIQSIIDEAGQAYSTAEILIACVRSTKNEQGETSLRPARLPKDLVKAITNDSKETKVMP